jgi:hypothetical protein
MSLAVAAKKRFIAKATAHNLLKAALLALRVTREARKQPRRPVRTSKRRQLGSRRVRSRDRR